MLSKRALRLVIICVILFCLGRGIVSAVDDGFGPARKVEGKYFTVYYSPLLEIPQLLQQLNITASDNLLAGRPLGEGFFF